MVKGKAASIQQATRSASARAKQTNRQATKGRVPVGKESIVIHIDLRSQELEKC